MMKKALLATAMLCTAMAVFAQSSSTGTNTVTSDTNSTAESSNAGNQQSITFSSPGEQSITSSQTLSMVKSGVDRSIVEYTGSYKLKNTPSVSGGNLTTSNDTCMGSTNGAVNGPGLGIGFGTTWTDENCKRLKMSRELWNKGFRAASLAVDCMSPEAREALELTGTRCPQSMTEEERRATFGETMADAGPGQRPGGDARRAPAIDSAAAPR